MITLLHALVVVAVASWVGHARVQADGIFNTNAMLGIYQHQDSGNVMYDWKHRVAEVKDEIPEYPQQRYEGKGIVMAFGGRTLHNCAYITLRLLRETHKCTLPIEVFYAGGKELSEQAITWMTKTIDNIKFISTDEIIGLPSGANLNGPQIRSIALIASSFAEVLWLDADTLPVVDPSFVFTLDAYVNMGALVWSCRCNVFSASTRAFDVFDLAIPSHYPQQLNTSRQYQSTSCLSHQPEEFDGGQMVLNKARVWRALYVAAWAGVNHRYFMTELFSADRVMLQFAFNTTDTPYSVVSKPHYLVGMVYKSRLDKNLMLCGNTMGQRHPDTGDVLFLHREKPKFEGPWAYLSYDSVPKAWTHMCKQPPKVAWQYVKRSLSIKELLHPNPRLQDGCFHPSQREAYIRPVDEAISRVEDDCATYMKDLALVPHVPYDPRDCDGDKDFFCKHV